ncbi:hypothetical protein HYQ45_017903 [Verticillium longisporum]|uniref:DUF6536 domain-containing protein n=1 Tax=Verticillium longisporum TaxID=100787 RepID=A0A8I2Z3M7_VERLO|nr:hypothetical protein HYQ45_017903 [Verticillium longisporum]KAG7110112.1 hypothetical protein HYQ44_011275 [Verticillium longisporum]
MEPVKVSRDEGDVSPRNQSPAALEHVSTLTSSSGSGPQTSTISRPTTSNVSRRRQSSLSRPGTSATRATNRQTIQWPFMRGGVPEDAEESSLGSPSSQRPLTSNRARRATWQHAKRESTATLLDFVPDYIINYLRGETPETLARKREKQNTPDQEDVAAALKQRFGPDGFFDNGSTVSRLDSVASHDDVEQMLGHGGGWSIRSARGFWASLDGWRGGIAVHVAIAGVILLTTIIFFVIAMAMEHGGKSRIFEGSCDAAQHLNFGLHVAINFFIVALLFGANYTFQVLSSPTRVEVELAHAGQKWLDIGIPSLRNFKFISKRRAALAAILLAAAISTQVIYNAVIFTTKFVPAHNILIVTESFSNGATFRDAADSNAAGLQWVEIQALQELASNGRLTRLNVADCLEQFSGPYQTDFSAMLLVADNDSQKSSLLQTASPSSPLTDLVNARNLASVTFGADKITSCLARPVDVTATVCAIDTNDAVLGAIILLVFVIIAASVAILAIQFFSPLVTLGDALGSFLTLEDKTVRGACLLTKADVQQGRWASIIHQAQYYIPTNHIWARSVSLRRWAIWAVIWAALVAFVSALLGIALQSGDGFANPISGLFSDAKTSHFLVNPNTGHAALAILSSLPQLLLACTYLSTNALLSMYYLSNELSLYAVPGASLPLRVSSRHPVGAQTSSLYLSLPRPISWLLLALWVSLSLFLSQSLHPVVLSFRPTTSGASDLTPDRLILAPDTTSLAIVLALLLVVAALVLTLGLRRADRSSTTGEDGKPMGNPLVLRAGSCSAVLAARCRRLASDRDAAAGMLGWGVIHEGRGDGDFGTTGFSSIGVWRVDLEKGYA